MNINNLVKQKTKVVFLTHSSGLGGAEKSMIELIKGINRDDICCHVIVPADGLLLSELKKMLIPVDVVYLPWCADGSKEYNKNRVNEIGKSVLEIIGILIKEKPDIIYSNSSVIFQGAIASKILGVKHIWHIREFGELDYGINFYLPIKERARFVFDYSDKIIFISNSLQKYYHQYISKEKSKLVYNNVQINKIESKIYHNKKGHFNLLMVGNVHTAKGQMDAVKAIKYLKDSGIEDIDLKIVGNRSPDYYEEIASFIKVNNLSNQVEFFDFVSNPTNFYQNTDVVLICSKTEGFGRVTVESMLYEKPVIGTNSGGTKEIIKDKENGLLYEVGDFKELAKKILYFYNNRSKVTEFGKKGRLYCENMFSNEKYVGVIKDIILKLKEQKNELFTNLFFNVFNKIEDHERGLVKDLELNKKTLTLITDQLNSIKLQLNSKIIEIKDVRSELNYVESQLNSTKAKLKLANDDLDLRINELNSIYYSRGWRFLMYLRKMLSFLILRESIRRKIISFFYYFSKKGVRFVLKIKSKFFGLFLRIKKHFKKPIKPYKRRINKNSKKILYVGHSYHNKTKSTTFLIDYLKEYFDVEIILDESWIGKPFPDLSFVDESYLAVIFFQLLPPKDVLNKIRNDNIIYIPMYDHLGRLDYSDWDSYRNIKMINFSKIMHDKFIEWGLESIYVQFFPKVSKFTPGNNSEAFFWQRVTHININTIVKLFSGGDLKIHIHKNISPGQEFIQPNKKIEDKFQITYSDWFETKDKMLDVVKQKGIYVAPREFEGIGMSFLEAMAMGKAVVAVDNPTMNEYITDRVNGYLFNLRSLKEINLSNIEQVQKNTYEYMKKGYQEWEKNKKQIIDFIKK